MSEPHTHYGDPCTVPNCGIKTHGSLWTPAEEAQVLLAVTWQDHARLSQRLGRSIDAVYKRHDRLRRQAAEA